MRLHFRQDIERQLGSIPTCQIAFVCVIFWSSFMLTRSHSLETIHLKFRRLFIYDFDLVIMFLEVKNYLLTIFSFYREYMINTSLELRENIFVSKFFKELICTSNQLKENEYTDCIFHVSMRYDCMKHVNYDSRKMDNEHENPFRPQDGLYHEVSM